MQNKLHAEQNIRAPKAVGEGWCHGPRPPVPTQRTDPNYPLFLHSPGSQGPPPPRCPGAIAIHQFPYGSPYLAIRQDVVVDFDWGEMYREGVPRGLPPRI
jgi:hypothetical protein